jgi:hypothetical protein
MMKAMPDPTAAPVRAPPRRTKFFISYRRDGNAGDAERLYDELKRYFPARHLFLDVKSIRTGDSFPLAIETALASGGVLLAVIGPRWLGATDEEGRRRLGDPSDMVRREVSAALAKGTWVIPVLMHGAAMPEAKDLPEDLKRLAVCQAVEIRSGHWERDVRELVALLKRRLYRRRRRTTTLSFAAALAVVAGCSYYFANVALPVHLTPDGEVRIPPVQYHEKLDAPLSEGEAWPEELIVEEMTGAGKVFRFDGERAANVRVDLDSARFEEGSVRSLQLKQEWGKDWAEVKYISGMGDPHAEPDFKQACFTSAVVAPLQGSAPPTSLRLFLHDPPAGELYRAITLSADRELVVNLDVKTGTEPENGPGCSKQLLFGEQSDAVVGYNAAIIARADAAFSFQIGSMDQTRTSPRRDLYRLGEDERLNIDMTPIRARRVAVRRHGREEIRCGDKLHDPTVSFEAVSADDKSSLKLQLLQLGAKDFILTADGEAKVTSGCQPVRPRVAERMWSHLHLTLLLLVSGCLALIGLVYSVARL